MGMFTGFLHTAKITAGIAVIAVDMGCFFRERTDFCFYIACVGMDVAFRFFQRTDLFFLYAGITVTVSGLFWEGTLERSTQAGFPMHMGGDFFLCTDLFLQYTVFSVGVFPYTAESITCHGNAGEL